MKKYVCYICILQFCFLSAFLNAAEVEFSRGKDNVRVSNGTNYTRLGNTMHGSDGSRYTQIGNTTYGSDGTRYTQVGNTTYSSNGSSYTRRGNVTTGSDGSRYAANGNTTNASCNTGKIDANPKKNAQRAQNAARKPILPASSRSNVTYRSSTDEYGNTTTYGSDGSSSYSSTDEYGNTTTYSGSGNANSAEANKQHIPRTPTFGF